MEIQVLIDWAMQNLPLAIGLLIGALLLVLFVLYLFSKGKLKAFYPIIEEWIVKVELEYREHDWRGAMEHKVNNIVMHLRELLPNWTRAFLSEALIKKVISSVYDLIEPQLETLVNNLKKKLGD